MINRARVEVPSKYSRLIGIAGVVAVILVLVIIGSLLMLSRLSPETVSAISQPSVTPSEPSTTVGVGQTTIPPPPGVGESGIAKLLSAARDWPITLSVGQGGQPALLMRTTAPATSFITNPAAVPVVEYFWQAGCATCGAENLVVASSLLALGGTFSGLTPQPFPQGVNSVSFAAASYHGPVVLETVEATSATGARGVASPQARAQFTIYDGSSSTSSGGTLPFLDVASHFVAIGGSLPTGVLSGVTLRSIASDLRTARGSVALAILGRANVLTAAICTALTQLHRPLPPVCLSSLTLQLEASLPNSPPR